MDCFHDFCLACDRESTSGPYCSQACRLADLEKASPPQSPTYPSFSSQQTVSSGLNNGSAYILAPPYKFPQRATSARPPSSEVTRSQPSSTDPKRPTQLLQRSLTPSSSRSSLSSNMSNSNGTIISEQARQELEEYFDYFAASRASKRRTSTH